MEDLFDPATHQQMRERILSLTAERRPAWGKMNATQMVTHCTEALRMVSGEVKIPRNAVGRIVGKAIKRLVLRPGQPMMHSAPTAPVLVIPEGGDFAIERDRLLATLDAVVAEGPAGCTGCPHPFFGPLTPAEWTVLAYKHLDHHLRQFHA